MELIITVSGICEDKGFKPKFYMLGELAKYYKTTELLSSYGQIDETCHV